jgi:replicative DNA helicase
MLEDSPSESVRDIFGPDFTVRDLTKDLTSEELTMMRVASNRVSGNVTYFDPSGKDIHQIRRVIRQTRSDVGPDKFLLVIVDGLHLLSGTGKEANRAQELTVISRGLKMAALNDCAPGAILAAHQLNYEGYPNGGKPNFSLRNLRDSGSLGQDADNVAFIYRPSIVEEGAHVQGVWDYMRLIFKKNRQTSGLTFIEMMMNKYTMRIVEKGK